MKRRKTGRKPTPRGAASGRTRHPRASGEDAPVGARTASTILDVARKAGVSVATVSRVFNGTASVKAATDLKVRRAAKGLNYWPNGAARSLSTNQTLTFGMLLPDLHGEFFSEVIRGADLEARPNGFHLIISSSHAATDDLIAALRAMRGRIDGLVVMVPDLDAVHAIDGGAHGVPTILLSPGRDVEGFHAISIDNTSGTRTVVRHLLALGHRRIATVTGPRRNIDARQRLDAYLAALRRAGVQVDPSLIFAGDFTEPSGYAAGRSIAALRERPTAVFVGNDKMAVGVLGAFSDAGVRVPDDIAVVGFDDIEMAQYLSPALTTVHADAFQLGRLAVRRLVEVLANGQPLTTRHEILETTLVVRGSCGASSSEPAATRIHRSELALRRASRPGKAGSSR